MKTDAELKNEDYDFLGWMNGWDWDDKPAQYLQCQEAGHQTHEVRHSHRGSDTTIYCDICKIWYKVDSSD
jgi:hypothetical protein